MNDMLNLIGRTKELFTNDIKDNEDELKLIISSSSFLILGGAGSIGQAVTKEIFKRSPKKLDVIDISENNMVELVRDIRSSFGYIDGKFATYIIDVGSLEFDIFMEQNNSYDYILNLSALKHVRSERDPFTLMRMVDTNIFNTDKTLCQAIEKKCKKYFCISTDKAANPVNMMGASKRIMEMFVMRKSKEISISMARFANVAFSDGSLLDGFNKRILKQQPIVAPNDIERYFVTPQESAELCLMSCIFGNNRDIFFPKFDKNLHLMKFSDIAVKYLNKLGYEPYLCKDEEEARNLSKILPSEKKWPCLFTQSDTTGEKYFEEFFTNKEILDVDRFESMGIIKNEAIYDDEKLNNFTESINKLKNSRTWDKKDILNEFLKLIPDFEHIEKGKFLDEKM
ncbi:UDP-GlcNac (UDP-linked N-acetylglucosamine) inverting 4,6-dehydratase [Arcobacter venerupis]|uniref:UDP-GlcNac (UDP-linked N-acetylglucosamine) inverting 4,6-dehydratase n=1 Tax=Arcobacter venerupis TaxID=1054033 RepID=A0AAE7E3S7_9BACT|nr:UDP-N-acetylglucosamine 4,6-dehydratase [Arcobacter venerupis]QKF67538.1 UDP-GlcNac (UDP-linked N-acetylglucosamine) inverting 4,6-dehydratase [Arcobacter venerupis]RWS50452.1 UDP-N-acetylglucosamine 4,6-dehydratase [Arcobacter venerupis]